MARATGEPGKRTRSVGHFPGAERLAGYAGTTPRAGGPLRADLNRYLKRAFAEAANAAAVNWGAFQRTAKQV